MGCWVTHHDVRCSHRGREGESNSKTVKSTDAAAVLLGMSPLQVVKWDDTSLFQHLGMPSQLV
jgi:hypothetical protein